MVTQGYPLKENSKENSRPFKRLRQGESKHDLRCNDIEELLCMRTECTVGPLETLVLCVQNIRK